MSTKASKTQPLRRSKRPSAVMIVEPTPRGPIRRAKRKEKPAPVEAVNGSSDAENATDDEECPTKKTRLETEGEGGGSGDDIEMESQESDNDQEKDEDHEKDIRHGHFHELIQYRGALGDINLYPRVALQRCPSGCTVNKDSDVVKILKVKPSSKEPVASTKPAVQKLPTQNSQHAAPPSKPTSKAEYRAKMEALAKSSRLQMGNHYNQSRYPATEKPYIKLRHINNSPNEKVAVQHKKQEGTKKTTAATKRSSESSCRGFMWHLCRLVLLLLLSCAVFLLYKRISVHQGTAGGSEHPSRAVNPEMFRDKLSLLEYQFPSQRPELWKMTKIHLEKHLGMDQPTEPVSLIFTAASSAEKTLHCLAQGLASSFSSALNASVLHIDGVSKARQDSDEVKLDMDSQLQAAFEGDKPVAVIHRFEELPPGSTLIFYRYCDHQNAAYKKVFLLFTVLLPHDKIGAGVSLQVVEEMVHDYVKEKFVGSSSQTAFNEMDSDKYGGLWSRISHLVLPVVSEMEVEQNGCS